MRVDFINLTVALGCVGRQGIVPRCPDVNSTNLIERLSANRWAPSDVTRQHRNRCGFVETLLDKKKHFGLMNIKQIKTVERTRHLITKYIHFCSTRYSAISRLYVQLLAQFGFCLWDLVTLTFDIIDGRMRHFVEARRRLTIRLPVICYGSYFAQAPGRPVILTDNLLTP